MLFNLFFSLVFLVDGALDKYSMTFYNGFYIDGCAVLEREREREKENAANRFIRPHDKKNTPGGFIQFKYSFTHLHISISFLKFIY